MNDTETQKCSEISMSLKSCHHQRWRSIWIKKTTHTHLTHSHTQNINPHLPAEKNPPCMIVWKSICFSFMTPFILLPHMSAKLTERDRILTCTAFDANSLWKPLSTQPELMKMYAHFCTSTPEKTVKQVSRRHNHNEMEMHYGHFPQCTSSHGAAHSCSSPSAISSSHAPLCS